MLDRDSRREFRWRGFGWSGRLSRRDRVWQGIEVGAKTLVGVEMGVRVFAFGLRRWRFAWQEPFGWSLELASSYQRASYVLVGGQ